MTYAPAVPRLLQLLLASILAAAPAVAQDQLVITPVTVVDVEAGVLRPTQTVIVKGDVITAVGPAGEVAVPADAEVVNGNGGYLIPGLWDMHVHSVSNRAWHFPLLLAHGVTGVRNMHTTERDPLAVTDSIRQAVAAGTLTGPRFVANGPIVDSPPATFPSMVLVESPNQARAAVDSLVAGGAEFIKVYDNLSPESFHALMTRAREKGVPVDGHLPFAVPPAEAAQAGIRTVEHTSGITMGCSAKADSIRAAHAEMIRRPPPPFPDSEAAFLSLIRAASDTQDDGRCAEVAAAYRTHGVAVTPTMVNGWSFVYAGMMMEDEAAVQLLPTDVAEQWRMMAGPGPGELFAEIMRPVVERTPDRVRLLHGAGVTILAGTDIGNPFLIPGHSLHQELEFLVEAGLTPLEAVRTATLNPSMVLGMTDSEGQIKVGYVADLVLLSGDPLEDIRNTRRIEAVVARGRYFDRAALGELLTPVR
ncbi:MAG: amidohydrolase family protein [Bacteroidetes bacterium]|jgi:imidazolonepropionase-like amidohydrolase|nr:amidohydrolase family protein [Bacteroidota bacterium]